VFAYQNTKQENVLQYYYGRGKYLQVDVVVGFVVVVVEVVVVVVTALFFLAILLPKGNNRDNNCSIINGPSVGDFEFTFGIILFKCWVMI